TDTFVPIASDVRDVAVLLRGNDEGEFPPVVGIAQRRSGRECHAVATGPAAPEHLVLEVDDRDGGSFDGRSVVEPGHEDRRVLGTVLYRDTQVRHLDHRCTGLRSVRVTRSPTRLGYRL